MYYIIVIPISNISILTQEVFENLYYLIESLRKSTGFLPDWLRQKIYHKKEDSCIIKTPHPWCTIL